ncbi:hypothetical protein SAMN05660748_4485 [Blastococcus aggregatus]|uniref:Uncharacterized protein n=2 Tax=Blastococcus aggregatus TaxID=38502 RepID=A0A285VHH7_9ACTN|nr:hypothetical protein SAMN05660748_4485 [Blastococcus aggregatus]
MRFLRKQPSPIEYAVNRLLAGLIGYNPQKQSSDKRGGSTHSILSNHVSPRCSRITPATLELN